MAIEGTLRNFHEALAQRLREAGQRESDAHLGVLAGGSRYLLKLEECGEVLPVPALSPVPLARPWFLGLANVRGNLVSVIDFASFCGAPAPAKAPEARLVLLADRFGMRCGLQFERLLGLKSRRNFASAGITDEAAPWLGEPLR